MIELVRVLAGFAVVVGSTLYIAKRSESRRSAWERDVDRMTDLRVWK